MARGAASMESMSWWSAGILLGGGMVCALAARLGGGGEAEGALAASGVLVVLIGRAAKASEYLSHDAKHYRATLRLGLTTDTEDTTGEVLTTSENIPTNKELQAILPRFRGEILQIPPMYSALKVGGQKLVDMENNTKNTFPFNISSSCPISDKSAITFPVSASLTTVPLGTNT